jgi:hypothetical protein
MSRLRDYDTEQADATHAGDPLPEPTAMELWTRMHEQEMDGNVRTALAEGPCTLAELYRRVGFQRLLRGYFLEKWVGESLGRLLLAQAVSLEAGEWTLIDNNRSAPPLLTTGD